MEVVKFNIKDKKELLELEKGCFGIECWDDDVWGEILADLEHNIIYLARKDNKIIGYLMIYNWGKEKNYVKITSIGTKKQYRGQKVAHKLIQTMLYEMKQDGMNDFRAETRITNYPMQKVFSDFKFEKVETLKGYYDNPREDGFRYGLNL